MFFSLRLFVDRNHCRAALSRISKKKKYIFVHDRIRDGHVLYSFVTDESFRLFSPGLKSTTGEEKQKKKDTVVKVQ